jgi:hypothetical protein
MVFQDGDFHAIYQRSDSVLLYVVIKGIQRPLNNSGIQVDGHPVLETKNIRILEIIKIKSRKHVQRP